MPSISELLHPIPWWVELAVAIAGVVGLFMAFQRYVQGSYARPRLQRRFNISTRDDGSYVLIYQISNVLPGRWLSFLRIRRMPVDDLAINFGILEAGTEIRRFNPDRASIFRDHPQQPRFIMSLPASNNSAEVHIVKVDATGIATESRSGRVLQPGEYIADVNVTADSERFIDPGHFRIQNTIPYAQWLNQEGQ